MIGIIDKEIQNKDKLKNCVLKLCILVILTVR